MEMLLLADIFPGPVLKHPPPGGLETYKIYYKYIITKPEDIGYCLPPNSS